MMIKRRSGEKAAMNGICGNCFINWYNASMVNKMWIPDSWTTSRVPVHKHKYR